MFCANCGKKVSDNALACPACGEPTKNQIEENSKKSTASKKALIACYLAAIFFPGIGFVVAIYLLFKHRIGHAIGVAAFSIIFMSAWYSAMMSGPDAANFSWECGATGASSLQCKITNAGPGTGTVVFDVVALCDDGEHIGKVDSGEVGAEGVVQRVVRLSPEVSAFTSCYGFEYRNEKIK